MTASAEPQCAHCGSTPVNWWTSWNVTGTWTCDDCTPSDPPDEDNL